MSVIVETEVFTIDELSDEARERALEWGVHAFAGDWAEQLSEVLSEALRDAFGPDSLTVDAWDYDRGYVNVSGRVCVSNMNEDHWLVKACPMPGGGVVRGVEFGTSRARDYGGSVWVDLNEGAPFGWADDAFDVLVDDMRSWVSGVESELVRVMHDEWEFLSSADELYECLLVHGFTFTVDGRRFS